MSRKKKHYIQQVGITQEGRPVVSGVYKTYETFGIPLGVLLASLEEKGALPCWLSLYEEAQAAGMKHDRITAMLSPVISDSYGPVMNAEVIKRLDARRV